MYVSTYLLGLVVIVVWLLEDFKPSKWPVFYKMKPKQRSFTSLDFREIANEKHIGNGLCSDPVVSATDRRRKKDHLGWNFKASLADCVSQN